MPSILLLYRAQRYHNRFLFKVIFISHVDQRASLSPSIIPSKHCHVPFYPMYVLHSKHSTVSQSVKFAFSMPSIMHQKPLDYTLASVLCNNQILILVGSSEVTANLSSLNVKETSCQGSLLFPKMDFFYKSSYLRFEFFYKYAKFEFFIERGRFL